MVCEIGLSVRSAYDRYFFLFDFRASQSSLKNIYEASVRYKKLFSVMLTRALGAIA